MTYGNYNCMQYKIRLNLLDVPTAKCSVHMYQTKHAETVLLCNSVVRFIHTLDWNAVQLHCGQNLYRLMEHLLRFVDRVRESLSSGSLQPSQATNTVVHTAVVLKVSNPRTY